MLANTLTITLNAVPYVLLRMREEGGGSVYRFKDADQVMQLQIRQTVEKATAKAPQEISRSNMFFEHTVYATPTAVRKYFSMSAVLRLAEASDPVKLGYIVTGFNTLLNAQAAAIIAGDI